MVKAKIRFRFSGQPTATVRIGEQNVFHHLYNAGISAKDAIDVDAWSDLAAVGEVYDGEIFDVTIVEE